MSSAPLVMRIMASSIVIANRAGRIIRDVMANGELGIVEKVSIHHKLLFCLSVTKVHLLSFLGKG